MLSESLRAIRKAKKMSQDAECRPLNITEGN